jgi:hypothetical protein
MKIRMHIFPLLIISSCLSLGGIAFSCSDCLSPRSSILDLMKDHRFVRYLAEYGDNPPEETAKILDFFYRPRSNCTTWLEIGCGDALVSAEIAKSHPDSNVIATDQFKRKQEQGFVLYTEVTADWEKGRLKAQKEAKELGFANHLAIARAEFDILLEVPDHSLDYLMLINPDIEFIQALCKNQRLKELLQKKLKSGGALLFYPYGDISKYKNINEVFHFQNADNFSWLEMIIRENATWNQGGATSPTKLLIWFNTPDQGTTPVNRSKQATASAV